MENQGITNRNNSAVRPRTDNKKYHDQQQRKTRKYHEECFTTEKKPPTDERRIRYKEDKSKSAKAREKEDDEKQLIKNDDKPNSRLKRKPRVEDKAFDDEVKNKTINPNDSCKSHHRKNCSKYSDTGKGKRHSGEITKFDDRFHIRKKNVLLPIDERENAATKRRSKGVKQAEGDCTKYTRRRASNEHMVDGETATVVTSELRKKQKHDEEKEKRQIQKQREREKLRKRENHRREASQNRNCYSDSEIDQTRTHIKSCAAQTYRSGKSDESGNHHHHHHHDDDEQPINVEALYNFYYKEESKASSKRKHERTKREGKAIRFPDYSPKRKEINPDGDVAETESAECKQSSIRGKLIRVLFKRVKDLLKETEKLRDERKEFMTRIDRLTNQVSGLQLKEEEHVTSELRIKERLNVIANDIDVTDKGAFYINQLFFVIIEEVAFNRKSDYLENFWWKPLTFSFFGGCICIYVAKFRKSSG